MNNRVRINFGSDYCGAPSCNICFRDAVGKEISNYTPAEVYEARRSLQIQRRAKNHFTNAPRFINNFYGAAQDLAKKIEDAAKEEAPKLDVEVKIVTVVKTKPEPMTVTQSIDAAKALQAKIAAIKALKTPVNKEQEDLRFERTPVADVKFEKPAPVVVQPVMEVTFDMLMGRKANIDNENVAAIAKDTNIIEGELVSSGNQQKARNK